MLASSENEDRMKELNCVCFIFLECSEGVGVSVHVAGIAFRASGVEGCKVQRVDGVLAH